MNKTYMHIENTGESQLICDIKGNPDLLETMLLAVMIGDEAFADLIITVVERYKRAKEKTEEELKAKVKEIFLSEKYQTMVLANTLLAVLLTKKIIKGKELKQIEELTVETMTNAWVKKYKDNPDVIKILEASELFEKF